MSGQVAFRRNLNEFDKHDRVVIYSLAPWLLADTEIPPSGAKLRPFLSRPYLFRNEGKFKRLLNLSATGATHFE